MPDYTITLSDANDARLRRIVNQHNGAHGTELSNEQWLNLHVRELAVAQDLQAEADTLRKQSEADLQAAIATVKQRLLSGAATPEVEA